MLALPKRFRDEMIAQAREEAPLECCGILAGPPGKVARLFRTANAEASPFRYSIDARELFSIYKEVEERGWEFLAFYHSHTFSSAFPSRTDVDLALWPDALYLIVSLQDKANPVLRAFRIVNREIKEEEIQVTEEPTSGPPEGIPGQFPRSRP